MKTLQDICRAYPLKVRIAQVQFECRSDYGHYVGRRDGKIFITYPLEIAVDIWKHPLDYVERHEEIHKYTKDELMQTVTNSLVSQIPDSIKTLVPNVETLIYDGLKTNARKQIEKGETSEFIHTEIEHRTKRIVQVYVPGYHAEYGGQSIDADPEILWENPNY